MIVSLLLLASLVGGLWYAGYREDKLVQAEKNLAYTSKRVELSSSSSLTTFATAEDFYYQLSTSSRLAASNTVAKIGALVEEKVVLGEPIERLASSTLADSYTFKDLKINNDSSSSSIKNFGLSISRALAPLGDKRPAEAPLIVKAVNTYDPAVITTLDNSIKSKRGMIKELLAIPTPRSGAVVSLKLINSLERMSKLLENMKQVKDKPVLAMESSLLYSDEVKKFSFDVIETNLYFRNQGIKFGDKETAKVYFGINN